MTTKTSHIRRYWQLYALGSGAALALGGANHFVPEFDWPSWIQAVGSIAAILAAVWVSSDQVEQQRQREAERESAEIASILSILNAEVETSLKYIEREISPVLADTKVGNPIKYTFRMPEYPFPIFDALIPKLGIIPSPALQRQIIHAFAQAKSSAITIQVHNDLADALERVEIRYRANPPQAGNGEYGGALRSLTHYGDPLRLSCEETLKELRGLQKTLSEACPHA